MKLTPTEDLIMEVLAARYRLGEHLWTMDSRTLKAAESLQAKGLVSTMHGIVEKSYRVSLTQEGRDMYLSATYSPPVVSPVIKKGNW